MGSASRTQRVSFLRKGEQGLSERYADTALKEYDTARWNECGTIGHTEGWTDIANAEEFNIGDTMIIRGVWTDKNNRSVMLYVKVLSVARTESEKTVNGQTTALICSGEDGKRGVTIRGPWDWASFTAGLSGAFRFESGGDSDRYLDIVLDGVTYYTCKQSFIYPTDSSLSPNNDDTHWQQAGVQYDFVATSLLLTKNARIENLSAEYIQMYEKDSDGNVVYEDGKPKVVFEAYDGEVTCKRGNFENITVSGEIKASSMKLKTSEEGVLNGAVVVGEGTTVLPSLSLGDVVEFSIIIPHGTRTALYRTLSVSDSSKVAISLGGNMDSLVDSVTLSGFGFKVFGIGGDDLTVWIVYGLSNEVEV